MIGRKLSHYRVREKIGAGGMGEVYLAHDSRLDRDVAIKVLPPGRLSKEARDLFRREALTLSKLNHPNIQTVHDFDSEGDVDFLVTEFVPGTTLSDKLEEGKLPADEVLKLGEQLAAGLEAAHESGIVHRDLKPSNLRVLPDGRLKILDFGLAKLVGPPSESAPTLSKLETQTFAGTPQYMAPEQRAGRPADARSDLYAVGLVLEEMLGEGRASQALAPIIERCREKDPAKRYQTAGELGEALRRASRPSRVPVYAAATAAAVIVIALVLAQILSQSSGSGDPEGIQSVVALPSDVLGPNAEAYLGDAIPRTLSTYLSQVDSIETKLPPPSVELERFRGDVDRIASTYGVDALVLSTLTAEPERYLLNVQLVGVEGRRLVWSGDFEGSTGDYLAIVRQAADELRNQLRPQLAAIGASHGSSQAMLAFERGMYHSHRFNHRHEAPDFDLAHEAVQVALERDPALADAAAEIAWLHEFKLEVGLEPMEARAQAHHWASRALALDDENGRAWALLTLLDVGRGVRGAEVLGSGLKAVRFAPRFPRSYAALNFALLSCRLRLVLGETSVELDPLYLYAPLTPALRCLGRVEDEGDSIEEKLSIDPNFTLGVIEKAYWLMGAGRHSETAETIERLAAMVDAGTVSSPAIGVLEATFHVVQQDESASAAFQHLLAVASGQRPFPYWHVVSIVVIDTMARVGRYDEARELLLALDRSGVALEYDSLMLSPTRRWIAEDPDLPHVVERARTEFEDVVTILDEARARNELPEFLEQPFDDLLVELNWER